MVERKRLSPAQRATLFREPVKRRRPRPKWTGVFENYAKQWVRKNYWRVRNVYDTREDALAGCALVFARVLAHYADTVDNDAWMMALYKQSLYHEWNTLATRDRQLREHAFADVDMTSDAFAVAYGKVEQHLGDVLLLLQQAPTHIRAVLDVLASAPAYILSGKATSVNRRLCDMAGIRECDALRAVEQFLTEGTRA